MLTVSDGGIVTFGLEGLDLLLKLLDFLLELLRGGGGGGGRLGCPFVVAPKH